LLDDEHRRLPTFRTRSRETLPQIPTRSKRIERKTAMNHVAIDLGGKESHICIRQPDGAIEARFGGTDRRGEALALTLRPLRKSVRVAA